MLSSEASRRALLAVAKLTFIAGATGCTGTIVVEKPDSTDITEPEEVPPTEDPVEPPVLPTDPETACFEGKTDTAKCCNDLLLASFADGEIFADPTLATDEEKACCDLAVAVMDEWFGSGQTEPPFDYSIPSSCCSTGLVEGGWDVHPSCTPWGPPMPPAMPDSLIEVLA